ncbi:MAG: DUF378 domain-containing protein [Candidatus Nanoarchaeia archaeon]
MAKNIIDLIALILVIVGALNWGLVGIGGWNLVNLIFGSVAWLEQVVYILVGLSGIWMIFASMKK